MKEQVLTSQNGFILSVDNRRLKGKVRLSDDSIVPFTYFEFDGGRPSKPPGPGMLVRVVIADDQDLALSVTRITDDRWLTP